jgi:hypothetical protein
MLAEISIVHTMPQTLFRADRSPEHALDNLACAPSKSDDKIDIVVKYPFMQVIAAQVIDRNGGGKKELRRFELFRGSRSYREIKII